MSRNMYKGAMDKENRGKVGTECGRWERGEKGERLTRVMYKGHMEKDKGG